MSVPKISIYTASTGELIKIWHPVKGEPKPCFSITYGNGGWMDGLYETEEAAKMGAELQLANIEEFYPLQKEVNQVGGQYRFLTTEDLQPLMEKHNVSLSI